MAQLRTCDLSDISLLVAGTQTDTAVWFLHGFSDCGAAFTRIFETSLCRDAYLLAPDLPGFGTSPQGDHGGMIADHVATLLSLIELETPNSKIGLVGHSLGSVIAAEAASILGQRCMGVFSIEGNITSDDAYFSGRAVDFENAEDFKEWFTTTMQERGADSEIFCLYHSRLLQADDEAMWRIGFDAKTYSKDDQPGHVLLSLDCPVHYFWCAENTPDSTQKFLSDYDIPNSQVMGTSHWPMLDAPNQVAESIQNFFGAK
ncbi:MAG: alpha/beta fold hydrolase [Rhodospirillales bacterium]|jgi:pimeloyl-ACP methyl ester carboxylesterase